MSTEEGNTSPRRTHSHAEHDDRSSVSFYSIPEWSKDPLLQGIEDATSKEITGCLNTSVKVKGYEVMKDKNPYVVYVIRVHSLSGSWTVRRRYTDFSYLHTKLREENVASLPALPPKQVFGSSLDPAHIEQRKNKLHEYLSSLIALPDAWLSNHLVLFLDNESRSLMFLWNVERMRRLQGLLSTMTADIGEQEDSSVQLAQSQVDELREKVASLEMFFLQHATGAAKEQLPSSQLRSLSGADDEEADKSRLRVGSDLPEFECLEVSAEIGTGEANVNKLLAAAHKGSVKKMTPTQLMEVLDLAVSPSFDKSSITSKSLRRKSADEVANIALSLELQDTLRMSKEVLPGTPVVKRKSLGRDSETSRISECLPSPLFEVNISPFSADNLAQFDVILDGITPSQQVLDLRDKVVDYIKGLALVTHQALVYPVGTFIRDTFSPEGDMDLTLCLTRSQFHHPFVALNEALCSAAMNKEKKDPNLLDVCNVSFSTSNSVKKCKANIGGVSVDISANQIRKLLEVIYTETIDDFIGKDHLFKKSLLLLKAWFFFEAPRYTPGIDILFADSASSLSSWALSVMMILIFNAYGDKIDHPLRALGIFFEYYTNVDFENTAVTVYGLASIDNPKNVTQSYSFLSEEVLASAKKQMDLLERSSFKHLRASKVSAEKAGVEEEEISETEVDDDSDGIDLMVGSLVIESKDSKASNISRHPFISCFCHEAPVFVNGAINIMDPLKVTLNLCSHTDSLQLSSLRNALTEGSCAYRAIMTQGSSGESGNVNSLLKLTSVYVRSVRADGSTGSPSFYDSQIEEHRSSLEIMQLILCSVPSAGGLIRMISYILEQRGPLPIGEIGKQLIEFTKSDLLVRNIKQKFGGLKKAIEKFDDVFELGTDHPFNPLVSLKACNDQDGPRILFPVSHADGSQTILPSNKGIAQKESQKQTKIDDIDDSTTTVSVPTPHSAQHTESRQMKSRSRNSRQGFYSRRGWRAKQDANNYMWPPMGYTLYGCSQPVHFVGVPPVLYPVLAESQSPKSQVYYLMENASGSNHPPKPHVKGHEKIGTAEKERG